MRWGSRSRHIHCMFLPPVDLRPIFCQGFGWVWTPSARAARTVTARPSGQRPSTRFPRDFPRDFPRSWQPDKQSSLPKGQKLQVSFTKIDIFLWKKGSINIKITDGIHCYTVTDGEAETKDVAWAEIRSVHMLRQLDPGHAVAAERFGAAAVGFGQASTLVRSCDRSIWAIPRWLIWQSTSPVFEDHESSKMRIWLFLAI